MIPLYVLAGGRSSRFGSDKARAEVGGVPLVRRVVDALRPVTEGAIVVAAMAGEYDDLGVATIGDDRPGLGPLGGLVTALRHADGPVFLAACDLRLPRADWAEQLISTSTTAAFRTATGWEPLFARYEPGVTDPAEQLLEAGRRSMQALLDEAGATAIAAPEGWPEVASINIPADLPVSG